VPLRRRRPGPRRWLSAGLLAAAAAAGLQSVAPDAPATRSVVVAAHDVPAGAALQAGDLRVARVPRDDVTGPGAASTSELVGQVVASPLAVGEPVTSTRLVGPGLLLGRPPDDVAAPVRLADAQATGLLRPGARVDVLVAVEGAARARTVARGATVLAGPGAGAEGSGGLLGLSSGGAGAGGGGDAASGGLVLLAVPATTAADLAQAAASGPLSVLLR
jgi:Flp pilus assembly protein CpaB